MGLSSSFRRGSAAALVLAASASLLGAEMPGAQEIPLPPSPSEPAPLTPPPPPPPRVVNIPDRILQPGATLTLAEILDLALRNNPVTRLSYLQARAAAAQLGAKRAPYLPSVDLTATASRAATASSTQDGTPTTSYGPALTLSYLLFDLGGRAANAEDARQALLAADWSHNAAIQNVVLAVQQTLVQYLGIKAQLAAAHANVLQAKTALEAATVRHDAGVATIAEVLQARTALSQAELVETTLAGQALVTRGALATAMGLPANTPYDVGTLPAEVPLDRASEAVEALIERARAERPDLLAARALAAKAAAHVTAVRSEGLPTVSLSAGANRYAFDVGNPGDPVERDSWSARLLLSYPLFTGFANRFNLEKAKEEKALAEAQVTSLEQQATLQVWSSATALTTAAQLVRTSRDLLASAEQSEKVALGRYREGVGTILDLLNAQAALANARAAEIQARAVWFSALAQLSRDTGSSEATLQTTAITVEKREP